MSNYKNCPYCSEQILETAIKCKHCGEWLNKEKPNNKTCPYCGEEIEYSAKKCKYCGEWLEKKEIITTSSKSSLPQKYRKFNWGAFLIPWIWGIGNKTYIGLLYLALYLLILIPIFGFLVLLAFSIWMGIKGNEFAWKNCNWDSLEQFEDKQRQWTAWGLAITCVIAYFYMFVAIEPILEQIYNMGGT